MGAKNKAPEYQAQEPAFLRQLRQQHAGSDNNSTQFNAHRPKRLDKDDQDDEPTYVLESGNETVSKEEYTKLLATGKDDGATVESPPIAGKALGSGQDQARQKPSGEAIVGIRKRKAAKAIVPIDDKNEDGDADDTPITTNPTSSKDSPAKKKKKRAVATTLSFGDED